MAREIFISYSRDDKALVHPFVEQISKAVERDCWIDMKGIESGEEFEEVIMKAIDECEVVLFMLSDSSLKKSKWTKREVYYAERRGKRIIPVVVDGNGLRGWFDFHFGNIDFIDIRSKEHKKKLINNLRDWLGVEEAKKKLEEEAKRKAEEKVIRRVEGENDHTIKRLLGNAALEPIVHIPEEPAEMPKMKNENRDSSKRGYVTIHAPEEKETRIYRDGIIVGIMAPQSTFEVPIEKDCQLKFVIGRRYKKVKIHKNTDTDVFIAQNDYLIDTSVAQEFNKDIISKDFQEEFAKKTRRNKNFLRILFFLICVDIMLLLALVIKKLSFIE